MLSCSGQVTARVLPGVSNSPMGFVCLLYRLCWLCSQLTGQRSSGSAADPLASHFTLSPYDFSSHDLKDDPGAQDSQVCISSQTSPDPSSLCPTSPSPWMSQKHTKAGTPQNKWSFPPPLLFSDPDGVSGASAHPTAQQEPEERLLILFSPFTSNL